MACVARKCRIECRRMCRLASASDGSSFVTHWMVVHKPLMLQFLHRLQSSSTDDFAWKQHILQSLPVDHLFTGFSEYASFISWVKQNHPERQFIMPRKTWMRQPLGGAMGVRLAAASHWSGACCPAGWQHWLQGQAGFAYYGFELGHHSFCRFRETAAARGTYGFS